MRERPFVTPKYWLVTIPTLLQLKEDEIDAYNSMFLAKIDDLLRRRKTPKVPLYTNATKIRKSESLSFVSEHLKLITERVYFNLADLINI